MDILSARKKAAERAQAQKKSEPEPTEAVQPGPAEQAKEAVSPLPGPVSSSGPADQAAPLPEEPAAEAVLQEQETEDTPIPEIELLSFRLGEEEYAVMVADVKEVLKNREVTPVPNAPEYILGVTSLRGPVLPVIDLCRRLGLPPRAGDEKSRVVVVNFNDEDTGILVDRVTGVLRINPDAVRPVPDTIERGSEFLRGIARKDDKLYILLDIAKALGTE